MKLKYNFEIMELGDEAVAVPFGNGEQEQSGVFKLNKSASVIFQMLKNDTTEEEIVCSLQKEYDNPKTVLIEYVHEIIQKLQDNNMLVM